jgi:hypothetical protein
MVEAWSASGVGLVVPADAAIEEAYWLTGSPPSSSGVAGGATDSGRDELSVLSFWRDPGIAGDRIGAFASVDPSNHDLVRASVFLFGGAYTGVALPVSAQGRSEWDVVGDGRTGSSAPGSWGGHAVPFVGYDAAGVTLVTWGGLLRASWAFVDAYFEEVYAIISPDFFGSGGVTIDGFDVAALTADLAMIGRVQK